MPQVNRTENTSTRDQGTQSSSSLHNNVFCGSGKVIVLEVTEEEKIGSKCLSNMDMSFSSMDFYTSALN